jgi:hypothetical protein
MTETGVDVQREVAFVGTRVAGTTSLKGKGTRDKG